MKTTPFVSQGVPPKTEPKKQLIKDQSMTISRRAFLGASAVAVGAGLPAVFQRAAWAAPKSDQPGGDQTVLVVVQLTGGNDGLNTVIPFRNPVYQAARPKLKQAASGVKKINDDLGFHSAMQGFADLLEAGQLAIVQGVGYPNPNRSHFESMDIWHKATFARAEQFGWLGRSLSHLKTGKGLYLGSGEGPLAMFSSLGHAPTVGSLKDYQLKTGPGDIGKGRRSTIENLATAPAGDDALLNLVKSSTQQTYASSKELERVADSYEPAGPYPETPLGRNLKLIAQLVDAGISERLYYTTLDGFDTHAGQDEIHARLLTELSEAVAAFQKDITQKGHGQRVLVMTFSEFGRRVKENGSEGTDHGVASQMFLIGEQVQPGLIGEHPNLDDLTDGDLKHHTDFRQIYATVLDQWLKIPSQTVLGKAYNPIEALRM